MKSEYISPSNEEFGSVGDMTESIAIHVSQRGFCYFQFGIVTILIFFGAIHEIYAGIYGENFIMRLTQVFDVSRENSIPTVFSIFNLLLSSALLFGIYLHRRAKNDSCAAYWLALSVLFLLLSIDEGASIHERASGLRLVDAMENLGVFLAFCNVQFLAVLCSRSWVIYGLLFCVAVLIVFIPFLRRIDHRSASLFCVAGALFVSGAVGLEYIEAFLRRSGSSEVRYQMDLVQILEEALEMYGIALFNSTLFVRMVPEMMTIISRGRASIH